MIRVPRAASKGLTLSWLSAFFMWPFLSAFTNWHVTPEEGAVQAQWLDMKSSWKDFLYIICMFFLWECNAGWLRHPAIAIISPFYPKCLFLSAGFQLLKMPCGITLLYDCTLPLDCLWLNCEFLSGCPWEIRPWIDFVKRLASNSVTGSKVINKVILNWLTSFFNSSFALN